MRANKFISFIIVTALILSTTPIIGKAQHGNRFEIIVSGTDKQVTIITNQDPESTQVHTYFNLPEDYELVYIFSDSVDASPDFSFGVKNTERLANRTIEYAEKTRSRLEETLEESNIELTDEMRQAYDDGLTHLENAKELYENEDYTQAYNKAIEALRVLGEAYRLAWYPRIFTRETEYCDSSTLERYAAFIEKIDSIITKLESQGNDLTTARELITEFIEKLEQAQDEYEGGDIEAFKNTIEECKELINEINIEIKKIANNKRIEKLECFTSEFKERIRKMDEVMELFRDRIGEERLYYSKDRLSDLFEDPRLSSDFLSEDKIDEYISVLEELVGETDLVLEDLGEDDIVMLIKSIYLLEARSKALEKEESLLSENMEILQELQSNNMDNLNDIYEALQNGDIDTAIAFVQELEYREWSQRFYRSDEYFDRPRFKFDYDKFDPDFWGSFIPEGPDYPFTPKWWTP